MNFFRISPHPALTEAYAELQKLCQRWATRAAIAKSEREPRYDRYQRPASATEDIRYQLPASASEQGPTTRLYGGKL